MTPKQKELLEMFESLGFNIKRMTLEQLTEELLHKYVEVSTALEWTSEENFERELLRMTKTATN